MRHLVYCLLVIVTIISGRVSAEEPVVALAPVANECFGPEALLVPGGSNVSSQEMLDAQANIELYITATRGYLNCLLAAEKVIGDALTYEQRKESVTRYNLAIARMEALVERFNEQLRTYKQVNKD